MGGCSAASKAAEIMAASRRASEDGQGVSFGLDRQGRKQKKERVRTSRQIRWHSIGVDDRIERRVMRRRNFSDVASSLGRGGSGVGRRS
jgi:hypothetical protein